MPSVPKSLLAAGFFWVLVFALYAVTLDSPFMFDDVPFIEKNARLAVQNFTFSELKNAAFSSTRPVTNLTFALNHLAGGHDTAGYHIVNMAAHALAGLGVFFLVHSLFTIPWFASRFGRPGWKPLGAAVLWLVHPVNTSAVAYIVQRSVLLSGMLCLWSLVFFIHARRAAGRRRPWLALFALASWLLAAGSKETALMLPFMVLIFEWFFFQDLDRAWAGRFMGLLAGLLLAGLTGALIYLGSHPFESILYDYRNFDFTMGQRVLTEFRVLVHYMTLLILPLPGRLVLDHDFSASAGLFSPPSTVICMAAVLLLLGFACVQARKRRLISYSILWFVVLLFLESSFIALDLVFEHRLYLPFIFPVIAVVLAVGGQARFRVHAAAALALIGIAFMAWTVQRNQVWESGVSLWRDTVDKAPGNARAHNNLGLAYANAGRSDLALQQFRKAVELKPGFGRAHYNLGIFLANGNKHPEAVAHFKKAHASEPENVLYLNDLALALMAVGRTNDALERLYSALKLEPDYAPTHNNLGVGLANQGSLREAAKHFYRAVTLQPSYTDAHRNLGITLSDLGRHAEAVVHFEAVLDSSPYDAQAHFQMGRSLVALGSLRKAAEHYKAAARTASGFAPVHYNAGLTLMALGHYEEAARYFRQASRLQPGNQDAQRQLQHCMEKIRESGSSFTGEGSSPEKGAESGTGAVNQDGSQVPGGLGLS